MTTKEDREEAIARQKRRSRLLRSLELYLPEMTDAELDAIETAMAPAVGRIAMRQE